MSEVRDELIELRGLRFHYRDWASARPDAPVLVLLHGYTGHARSWDAFAAAMAGDYRVLALDQRGHGETQWAPRDAYGIPEMVLDLEAFVAAMGLERFALLGLSMGGIVSFGYAGQRPTGLERLVIVDIAPEMDVTSLRTIQSNAARPDVFASREEAFIRARADNPRPPLAHHRARIEESLMRTADGQWTWRYDRALRDPTNRRAGIPPAEGWRLVANIAVPTLLVRGAESELLTRAVAERFVAEAPDCQLIEVAGSGHPVPLDRPDDFLAATRPFLLAGLDRDA